jgi:hypothetical protein
MPAYSSTCQPMPAHASPFQPMPTHASPYSTWVWLTICGWSMQNHFVQLGQCQNVFVLVINGLFFLQDIQNHTYFFTINLYKYLFFELGITFEWLTGQVRFNTTTDKIPNKVLFYINATCAHLVFKNIVQNLCKKRQLE